MKKVLLILIAVLILGVSCNLDNEEGLFQHAGVSQYKESYKEYRIVGKNTEGGYYITTDTGIICTKGTGTVSCSGNLSSHTLYATEDYILYSNDTEGIKKLKKDGTTESTNYDGYILCGQPYTCLTNNGANIEYSFVVKKADSGNYYIVHAVDDGILTPTFKPIDNPYQLGINPVGNNIYMLSKKASSSASATYELYFGNESTSVSMSSGTYYFAAAGTSTEFYAMNQTESVIKYQGSSSTTLVSNSNTLTNNAVVYFDGTNYLFVASGSSKVYSYNPATNSATTYTVSGLNSVHILGFISCNGSTYQVLTSNSGIKKLTLGSNSSID